MTNANGGILMPSPGSGFASLFLNQRTLNNAVGQTATMNNDADLIFSNGAVFNNNGTFLAQGNDQDGFFNQGGGGTFNNVGTFTRNTGTDIFTIANGIIFNNSGTVNVQSGSLELSGGEPARELLLPLPEPPWSSLRGHMI